MDCLTHKKTTEFEIWGKKVPVYIHYDRFRGEKITAVQAETYALFMSEQKRILDDAFTMIREYCMSEYSSLITDGFKNIFKYVRPRELYIKRSVTGRRIAGLLCQFKLDIEHGLAVYIEDGVVTKIGPQDIIL